LASVFLQKQKIKQQQNELATVNLSMQEQALINRIAAAERMAGYQCRDYNADHPAWIKVNALLKEQEDLFVQKKQTWAVSDSVISNSDDDIMAASVLMMKNYRNSIRRKMAISKTIKHLKKIMKMAVLKHVHQVERNPLRREEQVP